MFTCPILFLKFCSHISHHYLHRSTTHIQFLHYDKSDNGQDSAPRISIPPSPQCFTSCVIVFMHITAILVNNSFIIHDFQLNNAQDSFVNLFYPSLIYSEYPLILFFIGFPLVDLNSVGYNLVSCGSASGWHKILVPHYSLGLCLSRSMWYVKYRKNGRWLYTWSHYMHRSIKWGVRVVQTPTVKIQIF